MNEEQKLFLKFISSYLHGEKNVHFAFDDTLVSLLETLAVRNFCLPFLYEGFVNNFLNAPSAWKQASSYIIMDSYHKLAIESEIVEILKSNGIDSCILKGSSVALNYPNPLSRPMGDIDVLVSECDYEKASLLFISKEQFDENRHDFHVGFNYKNVRIEIHRFFTEYSQDNMLLNQCIRDAISHVCIKKYDKFCIPVLSEPYQALSLLTHMVRHFKENKFVFRMYCDWICFVRSVSQECWQQKVYPLIENCGLSLFCDALNKSAMIYLEFDMESKLIHNSDAHICEFMMEEFLSVDKNTTADEINANLGTILSLQGKNTKNVITSYFAIVNSITKNKYFLGKYKLLQPIFWIWLPIKYIFNIAIGRRKKLDYKKIKNTSMHRKKIIDALNLHI